MVLKKPGLEMKYEMSELDLTVSKVQHNLYILMFVKIFQGSETLARSFS